MKSVPMMIDERERKHEEAFRLDNEIHRRDRRVSEIESEFRQRLAFIIKDITTIILYHTDPNYGKPYYRTVDPTADFGELMNRVNRIYRSHANDTEVFLVHHRAGRPFIVGSERELVEAVDFCLLDPSPRLEFEVCLNFTPIMKRKREDADIDDEPTVDFEPNSPNQQYQYTKSIIFLCNTNLYQSYILYLINLISMERMDGAQLKSSCLKRV